MGWKKAKKAVGLIVGFLVCLLIVSATVNYTQIATDGAATIVIVVLLLAVELTFMYHMFRAALS